MKVGKNGLPSFKFIAQHDAMDCGPACLAMVAKSYGKNYSLQLLRDNAYLTREGVSLTGLSEAASMIGFDTMSIKTSLDTLVSEKPFPSILFWNNGHFVVLYKVVKSRFSNQMVFHIADPAVGLLRFRGDKFADMWLGGYEKGIALLLEPTDRFYLMDDDKTKKNYISALFKYARPYNFHFIQVLICLAVSSLFTLIFPFLTQALIDDGITTKDVNIVSIILFSQLFLFIGSTITEIVRNWLVLYIGARINISVISDFFKKIMLLPLKFFDTKFLGDFYQRVQDHSRIENFLTSQSLTTFFSLVNFLIFFAVLLHYDSKILIVYSTLTVLAILWSRLFLKRREKLDYFRFRSSALNQESVNEMINGIQEIKLNNFEDYKREQWERVQVNLFDVSIKSLALNQYQLTGFDFINQLKNIIVTFIAAREAIKGNISLGGMLSVSYILGQMNSPINQLVAFFRSLQDAQLSMKRLAEVQNMENEKSETQTIDTLLTENSIKGLEIRNLSFRYEGPYSPLVLDNINLLIPKGKTTAIVGGSGSGKTTLMKLMLQFYEPNDGSILIDGQPLNHISPKMWRQKCGVVLQDGYIFSETINRNIATSDVNINSEILNRAIRIANIENYIESLPTKGETKIGAAGSGISGGQRQRILIARAVYKQPSYIFFDEATSSLDTENEKKIHDELHNFFTDKTVVIIAHRLSTVRNADQIVVLKEGKIVETGNHTELINKRGSYYNLVKNQLELEINA